MEQAAWFLVWFTLPFSLKLSGASIILATMVILFSYARKPFRPDRRKLLYLLPPVLFFLWHAKEVTGNQPFLPAWKETEQMLSFLVIPLLFALTRITKEKFTIAAMWGLVPALLICGAVMLGAAGYRFALSGNWNEFTYHTLGKPFRMGAIYFSFYLLFALFKLDDPAWLPNRPGLKIYIGIALLFLLLLSASKLFIGLGIPLLAWHNRQFIQQLLTTRKKLSAVLLILVLLGLVPFLKRVQFLAHPDIDMVGSTNFKDCPEPNGLNLRLIFIRFGKEILDEQHAWISGVGMNRSHPLLNEKIVQYGMYTGTRDGSDTGYLNYNFHDQFMETLVKTGIPGLVILLAILTIFAIQCRERLFTPKIFLWIVAGFFLTESVLGRQAGIVFFCLIMFACFTREEPIAQSNER